MIAGRFTEDEVRAMLASAVEDAGGQRAFSRLHRGKPSAAYVGLVLNGDPLGASVLKALGIEAVTVTTYRRVRK